jgi:hypothetical protein
MYISKSIEVVFYIEVFYIDQEDNFKFE